jgi:hypothetical protein
MILLTLRYGLAASRHPSGRPTRSVKIGPEPAALTSPINRTTKLQLQNEIALEF